MDYAVNVTQSGRGGIVYYLENAAALPFDWEFAVDGALVFVPSPPHWGNFCERNGLPHVRDGRDEILKRVCEEIIRQKAAGAKYTIGDDYVSISFS